MEITRHNLDQLNAEGKITVIVIAADKTKITEKGLFSRIYQVLEFLPAESCQFWLVDNKKRYKRENKK